VQLKTDRALAFAASEQSAFIRDPRVDQDQPVLPEYGLD
jgi:hypothetical protein